MVCRRISTTCVVSGCSNKKYRLREGGDKLVPCPPMVSFHRFPLKDAEVVEKWVEFTKRKDWKPTVTSRVCSDHFRDQDYVYRPAATNRLLKTGAVPSLVTLRPSQRRLKRNKAVATWLNNARATATNVTATATDVAATATDVTATATNVAATATNVTAMATDVTATATDVTEKSTNVNANQSNVFSKPFKNIIASSKQYNIASSGPYNILASKTMNVHDALDNPRAVKMDHAYNVMSQNLERRKDKKKVLTVPRQQFSTQSSPTRFQAIPWSSVPLAIEKSRAVVDSSRMYPCTVQQPDCSDAPTTKRETVHRPGVEYVRNYLNVSAENSRKDAKIAKLRLEKKLLQQTVRRKEATIEKLRRRIKELSKNGECIVSGHEKVNNFPSTAADGGDEVVYDF